jgi:hypothetical protein
MWRWFRSGRITKIVILIAMVDVCLATASGWRHGFPFSRRWIDANKGAVNGQLLADTTYVTRTRSVDGAIEGAVVSIPSEYLAFGVEYVGIDSWKPAATDAARRKVGEIRDFTLHFLYPDFRPGGNAFFTLQNAQRLPLISVEVERAAFPWKGPHLPASVAEAFTSKRSREGWSYKKDGQIFGLDRLTLDGPDYTKPDLSNVELLYDGDAPSTLITCGNGTLGGRAFEKCTALFQMPNFGWWIQMDYAKTYLPEWRAMQSKAIAKVLTFVRS